LEPRMAEIMSRVLLFPSILFTSSNLYTDRVIKRSSAILGSALTKLVELGFLFVVKKGLFSSKWTPIYLKKLPDTDSTDDQMAFEFKLAELGVSDLSLSTLRDTCNELNIDGKGKVSKELIDLLQRPEYSELNLDTSILIQRSTSSKNIFLLIK